MTELSGVEFRDIASGKFAIVVSVADINVIDLDPSSRRRPPRAVIVPDGAALEVVGIDNVNVILPDMGGAWQWDLQISELVAAGSAALTVVLIW